MNLKVTESGMCVCDTAPMGHGGLEGFNEKETYRYQIVRKEEDEPKKGFVMNVHITHHARVYHDANDFSTCGLGVFREHFKPLEDGKQRHT